jgi:hypothetical protein
MGMFTRNQDRKRSKIVTLATNEASRPEMPSISEDWIVSSF